MIERLMPVTTLSRSEPPTVTIKAPKKMMPPTMAVLSREAKRLRNAICSNTRKEATASMPGGGQRPLALARPLDHFAVREPHDGRGVGHHLGIVGRENEG